MLPSMSLKADESSDRPGGLGTLNQHHSVHLSL
ncbi:hypothetical protein M3J07_010143 [Ascochyta lentis]